MDMLDATTIKGIRNSLGLTQTEFAFHLGVSTAAVSTWEVGTRHPSWNKMVKINELAKQAKRSTPKAKAAV